MILHAGIDRHISPRARHCRASDERPGDWRRSQKYVNYWATPLYARLERCIDFDAGIFEIASGIRMQGGYY